MTKVAKVQANSNPIAIAISTYNASPAKSVNKMVRDSLTLYAKVAVRLHYTACFALFHLAETGDNRPINSFFDGLRQNDQDALRIWVGKLCKFNVEQEDGSSKEDTFMRRTDSEGFKVRAKMDAVSKGFFDLTELLNGASFMDVNQDAEKKAIGLAEILAALARIEKQMTKKAEDNDVTLPDTVKSMLSNLTSTAQAVGNTLGATKH